ncbi:MAG: type II toxin-antitoxin system Phd/YefM family antitoxin [Clostridiales bacterium]|nr:type II toxin-antitoxin system Phd/YefM family antitoxin [Clostridiales bacterium]
MQIIPIRDLKETAKISEMCNLSNEPIFVTKNGYGDMVIMSIKTYEASIERNTLLARLAEAEHGDKLVDGEAAMRELRHKYVKKD